jgi:hypothetical protein
MPTLASELRRLISPADLLKPFAHRACRLQHLKNRTQTRSRRAYITKLSGYVL